MSRAQDITDLRDDARYLRVASAILQSRSKRPRSFALHVLCRVLEHAAARIDREADKL